MPVVVGRQRGERCRRRRSGLRPMPKSLVAMLAVEVAVFSLMAQHFLSIANAAEVVRLGIELGLLSVAITPVIVTGGIDLSIGSMLGLSAVVMGAAYREWHFSIRRHRGGPCGGLRGRGAERTARRQPPGAAADCHAWHP